MGTQDISALDWLWAGAGRAGASEGEGGCGASDTGWRMDVSVLVDRGSGEEAVNMRQVTLCVNNMHAGLSHH